MNRNDVMQTMKRLKVENKETIEEAEEEFLVWLDEETLVDLKTDRIYVL